jgi:pyruvate/2-oxoglutarate dehydrogenase complex dihydrolipoamide acyltransferase (E2) component
MAFLKRNIELGRPLRTTAWRKVAIGTWRDAGDPSVYAQAEFECDRALAYIDKIRTKTGSKITMNHFVGKAIALTLAQHRDINGILRFGRIYPRKNVDIFFQVASDTTGKDLSGITIRNIDKKSILEISAEMQARVDRIRKQGDPEFRKMKGTMGGLPGMFARYVLNFAGFLMYTLNLWSPLLGSPRDPFGSCMITNIGSLGLDSAFAPLVPYSRVPLLIALGAVKPTPVVRDGALAVAQVVRLCVTLDHRLIDGMHASHMARTLTKIFANPESELGDV